MIRFPVSSLRARAIDMRSEFDVRAAWMQWMWNGYTERVTSVQSEWNASGTNTCHRGRLEAASAAMKLIFIKEINHRSRSRACSKKISGRPLYVGVGIKQIWGTLKGGKKKTRAETDNFNVPVGEWREERLQRFRLTVYPLINSPPVGHLPSKKIFMEGNERCYVVVYYEWGRARFSLSF